MTWLLSIFSGISTRLAAWGMALAGILAAVLIIRKSGADSERNKTMKKTLEIKDAQAKAAVNSPRTKSGVAKRLREGKF